MSQADVIAAAKAKLSQFKRQTNRDDSIWKPVEGKTTIRIVPYKENPDWPFVELYFHYLGGKTHLSPTSYGNRDPILEFADVLSSGGTKDDWAQARPFRPKLRTYVPVLVRGEESKGVRWFGFGKTVYNELVSIIADPEWGDITHPETGRDIVIEYIPEAKSETSFAKTMVRPKPNVTPLADSKDTIQALLNDQPDLRSVYKEYSYEELKVFLERYLDPSSASPVAVPASFSASNTSTSDPDETSGVSARSEELKTSSVKDMIDEFDEVFG